MKKYYCLVILLLVSFFKVSSFEKNWKKKSKCFDSAKIKFTFKGKLIEKNIPFCVYQSSTGSVFTTSRCLKKECYPFKNKKKSQVEHSTNFNPGIQICMNHGGEFQYLDYYFDKSWVRTNRCLFPDGEFIDAFYLLKLF